ncbi:unnamed protein product, partial [Scytosiphon promiscuus]
RPCDWNQPHDTAVDSSGFSLRLCCRTFFSERRKQHGSRVHFLVPGQKLGTCFWSSIGERHGHSRCAESTGCARRSTAPRESRESMVSLPTAAELEQPYPGPLK